MATNVTVHAIDGQALVYLDNGDVVSVEAESEYSFQLPEGSFCTVSDAPEDEDGDGDDEEEGEHPPQGYALADAMIEFWNRMKQRWQDAVGGKPPTATPL